MATTKMSVANIGGTISLSYTGKIVTPADGVVTVDVRDAPALLAAGANFIYTTTRRSTFTTPVAATAGRLVASTSLANGTLSVANQPDVPRQGVLVVNPGTSAITAGTASIPYIANDGSNQTDSISLVMPGTTVVSTLTSKGIMHLSPVIVTGLVGGASPLVQVNDTNSLSVTVDQGFVDFTMVQELADSTTEGQVSVASTAASFTPSTAPNGTHSFTAVATYNVPMA